MQEVSIPDHWMQGIVLGGLLDEGAFEHVMDGTVQYFAVFDRSLSPSEISTMASLSGAMCAQQERGAVYMPLDCTRAHNSMI